MTEEMAERIACALEELCSRQPPRVTSRTHVVVAVVDDEGELPAPDQRHEWFLVNVNEVVWKNDETASTTVAVWARKKEKSE